MDGGVTDMGAGVELEDVLRAILHLNGSGAGLSNASCVVAFGLAALLAFKFGHRYGLCARCLFLGCALIGALYMVAEVLRYLPGTEFHEFHWFGLSTHFFEAFCFAVMMVGLVEYHRTASLSALYIEVEQSAYSHANPRSEVIRGLLLRKWETRMIYSFKSLGGLLAFLDLALLAVSFFV